MYCKHCGQEITTEVCPHCGTKNVFRRGDTEPSELTFASKRASEKVVFNGHVMDQKKNVRYPVVITPQRVTIGNATYSTANITSVSIAEKPPVRLWGILLALIGLIAGGIVLSNADDPETAYTYLAVCLGIFILGVLWAILAQGQAYLAIVTAAGEIPALWSRDRDLILTLVRHIETAIIERG